MRKVNKKSSIPIYYQLKEIILEMIDNEDVSPGDLIPTERELCEFHDISRMTVRMAIMELVNEGILYREQGKGTYVAHQKPKRELTKLTSFTEEMKKLGHKVETVLLSFKTLASSKKISKVFNIREGDELIELIRLRIIDDEPYAIETVWLEAKKYPGLVEDKLENRSLYDVLASDYRVEPHYAKQTIEPVHLNDSEKSLFKITGDSLGLLFYQTTYTKEDTILEYTRAVYRIDKHKFELYLEA
ncbi:MAG TPA: GntR family transcriptional regulator [Pseudogracilibacillus sp.]|nr:GntR family transcriptional regulator [Pseudogracilibacillus sp.]